MSTSRTKKRTRLRPSPSLEQLQILKIEGVREAWQVYFEETVPAFRSRDLLIRALIYRLDNEREGGLKPAVKKRLTELAERFATEADFNPSPRAVAPIGSALVREWNGVRHVVLVTTQGFAYLGETYRSLTLVAKAISGIHQSGPRFFGLVGAKIDTLQAES